MSIDPPEPLVPDRCSEIEEGLHGSAVPEPATSLPGSAPIRLGWGWALAAGLLAGALAGGGGEASWREIRASQTPRIVGRPSPADRDRVLDAQVSSNAVSFIQQGAILGTVLGLAGGLARRSIGRGLGAALAGLVLGGAAAALTAHFVLPEYFHRVEPDENALTLPLLTHGAIWAAVGLAAGLALGLGLGGPSRWARGALGGLLGGVAATMVYDLVGALAFPLDKTSHPVSATVGTRLFAQLAVALFVAIGAALGADDAPRSAPPAP
jgi:hypothetical protein